jgi:tetratricopeptide (TPR) repeat protein
MPQLAERFSAGDTTLTVKQLSILYYGYAINADHDPANEARLLDAASSLGRRERYEEAISLLDSFLKNNPGSLAALLERAYTSWLVDDSLGTVTGYEKYYRLMEVPLQSGKGTSWKEPMTVSSIRDMELVMDKKGYFIKSQSLLNREGHKIYMLTCGTEADPKGNKYFYFNVDLPYGQW